MWSQGPGNETWRMGHLRWTLRCGEGPDRWKSFEKVVQGEGPTGAKAQRLENMSFFYFACEGACVPDSGGRRCGKEKDLRTSCRSRVDRVCFRSSPESGSIKCILPCLGGGSGYIKSGVGEACFGEPSPQCHTPRSQHGPVLKALSSGGHAPWKMLSGQ